MTCTTVAQLLQPSLAFCLSLQPMTAYRPVVQDSGTCFMLYCVFYFTCDRSFTTTRFVGRLSQTRLIESD